MKSLKCLFFVATFISFLPIFLRAESPPKAKPAPQRPARYKMGDIKVREKYPLEKFLETSALLGVFFLAPQAGINYTTGGTGFTYIKGGTRK